MSPLKVFWKQFLLLLQSITIILLCMVLVVGIAAFLVFTYGFLSNFLPEVLVAIIIVYSGIGFVVVIASWIGKLVMDF